MNQILYLLLGCLSASLSAGPWFNMPYGATEVSQAIYKLHMIIFWICVVIGVLVFGVMTWAIVFHRKSLGVKAANFHENTKVEILWTVIPFIILVAMAYPATKTLIFMYDTKDSDLTVKITGYMWKWHYDYLDYQVGYMSNMKTSWDAVNNRAPKAIEYVRDVDNELVLPINKKVRLLTTANDVIHSWWVPELGIKKDAIPGFINETWTRIKEPGVYRGQCAELCGANHAYMPIVVRAVTEEEFEQWLANKKGANNG